MDDRSSSRALPFFSKVNLLAHHSNLCTFYPPPSPSHVHLCTNADDQPGSGERVGGGQDQSRLISVLIQHHEVRPLLSVFTFFFLKAIFFHFHGCLFISFLSLSFFLVVLLVATAPSLPPAFPPTTPATAAETPAITSGIVPLL